MSEQILKFGDFTVNKIEFHASKQGLANLVNTTKIVVSDKFKHSDDGLKYFIFYLHDDDIIRPLYIILPQMGGYIKYFDNDGKNMSRSEIPKQRNHYICIGAICIDSVLK